MIKLCLTCKGREELERIREAKVPFRSWPQYNVLQDLELRGETSYESFLWPNKDTIVGRRILRCEEALDWYCKYVDDLVKQGCIKEV
jgi:hypothetical protein